MSRSGIGIELHGSIEERDRLRGFASAQLQLSGTCRSAPFLRSQAGQSCEGRLRDVERVRCEGGGAEARPPRRELRKPFRDSAVEHQCRGRIVQFLPGDAGVEE